MYRFLKLILFRIDPERAHYLTMWLFIALLRIPGMKGLMRSMFSYRQKDQSIAIAGMRFSNPVGLAAGFDKNARFLQAMATLGFSHIEVGTVTPRPQPGNPKPRLFRLIRSEALINRMGFNNDGVEAMAKRLQKPRPKNLIIGANIGKNKDTPNENAADDYLICFRKLYDLVDYFTVNVSSPNTPGLRELQEKEPLTKLLSTLQAANTNQKPIFLKIAPDLTLSQLDEIVEIIRVTRLTGLIATNTTIARDGLTERTDIISSIGVGGLSGKPILEKSVSVVRYLKENSKGQFVIVGVGGICDGSSARKHLDAGADLIQVYTGFIYKGPSLVKNICKGLG